MSAGKGSDESESLCVSCGLCCDGTLFSFVPITTSELPWAERLRLPMMPRHQAFLLRCPCLDGTRCGEYLERPGSCRTYRCKLLKRLDAGETTLEDALAKVATTKALCQAAFPDGRAAGAPPDRENEVLWKLDAAELVARLDRDFKPQT